MKITCSGAFSVIVGCRKYSCNCNTLHTITEVFSRILSDTLFLKVFGAVISKHFHEFIGDNKFNRVLGYRLCRL